MMQKISKRLLFVLPIVFTLNACSYNPLASNNRLTGNVGGTAVGAIIGAGTVAALGASKPVVALAGLGGGSFGYYLTTQRARAAGIIEAGGQVYSVGDYVGIEIPNNNLFEPASADFIEGASVVLESVIQVLKQSPNNHVLVSGNLSGFDMSQTELQLSEARASRVAAYLWMQGVSRSLEPSDIAHPENSDTKLSYVGYGNYFPVAQSSTHTGIRQNSRIQIISFPPQSELYWHKQGKLAQPAPKPVYVSAPQVKSAEKKKPKGLKGEGGL